MLKVIRINDKRTGKIATIRLSKVRVYRVEGMQMAEAY